MKNILSFLLIIIIIITDVLFQFSDIYAAVNDDVLQPINDNQGHQALRWTVQGISSTAPKQAFVIAWNIRFETPDGKHVTINVPRAMTSWDSQPRTYTYPLTDEWKGTAASGMLGGNSIEDFVSDEYKVYYRKIIEDPNGCDITANAEIQKYWYDKTKTGRAAYTAISTAEDPYAVAASAEELLEYFKEYTPSYLSNTTSQYFNIRFHIPQNKPELPKPSVKLILPSNGSTVLQGTTVVFKGTGTGVHHISGFVNGQFLDEQSNPNDSIREEMTYQTTVTLDEIGDYKFQIKGRNTPNPNDQGSLLADSSIQTVHVIKPPPDSGVVYIKCINIDNNTEIPDTSQTIPGIPFGKPKTVTYPPIAAYKVQGSYQTFSTGIPDKSKMETSVSQTVTLSSINKNAYVYFWYKADPTEPPKPPPKINYDPIAIISNPPVAYAGDDVSIDGSRSYDEDGNIEHYYWDLPGAYGYDPCNPYENGIGDNEKGTVWYPGAGTYDIDLEVVDDGNCSGYAESSIQIIEPKPEVVIDVLADKMKENRKITLDTSNSKSAARFPIDWSLTAWIIQPVNGTGATGDYGVRLQNGTVYKNVNGKAQLYNNGLWTNTGLDFNSVLKGQKIVYFQARDRGQYKITVSMTNTYTYNSTVHYSNTVDRTITIVEDLAPAANFSGSESNIRDFENPVDKTLQKYGVIPVICTSASPDGDPIGKRIWSARYDSDNDLAQGAGAAAAFADETTIYPYTGTDPLTSGVRLVVDDEYDSTAEIRSYEVGKYTLALQVYEDIPDSETVKELLIPGDFKGACVQGW